MRKRGEKYLNYFRYFRDMRIRKISEIIGTKVFTDSGDFFGEIEEVNLSENKVDGWRIRVGGNVVSMIGGAKGVIIPHQFVKSIGEIFIITKSAVPAGADSEDISSDLI